MTLELFTSFVFTEKAEGMTRAEHPINSQHHFPKVILPTIPTL